MPDFDAVETGGDQWLEPLAPPSVTWVSPDRNCTRLVGDCDGVLNGKLVLRYERAPLGAKVAGECVAKITHDPTRDHRSRNVWSPNRSAIRLQENFIQRQRDAELVEPVDYPSRAGMSGNPQIGQPLFERTQLGEMKSKQVNFMVLIISAQLDAGDHPNSGALRRFARRTYAVYGVVIRERESREAAALRCLYYALGWECAVRGGRVGMEVDERRPARRCAHRS
jgi:hypothetical protein